MRRPALRSFAWPILLAVLAAAGCTGWESMYRANPAAPWALPIPDARLLTIVDNDDTLRTADTLVANGQMLLGASACAEIDLPRAKLKALRVGALTLAVQTLPFTTAGGARSNVYVVTYWVPAGAITPNRAAERELVAEVWASRPNVRYLDAKHLVRRMDEAAAASRALVLDESQIERAQLFTASWLSDGSTTCTWAWPPSRTGSRKPRLSVRRTSVKARNIRARSGKLR